MAAVLCGCRHEIANLQVPVERCADAPVALTSAAAFSINGQGYVFGGRQADGSLSNHLYTYDAASDTWTDLGETPLKARVRSRAVSVDDEVYIGLGFNGKVLIDSVKKGALRAARAMERGDIEAFARCVNDYWRDKKLLDAGSTNEKVDDIIDAIRPYVSAVSLAGAGGGGFMYILAKSRADARRIRAMLERNPPSRHSRFYDFGIDHRGMALEEL